MPLSSTVTAGCVLVWAASLFMALRATSITVPPHAGNEAISGVAITCTIGFNVHGIQIGGMQGGGLRLTGVSIGHSGIMEVSVDQISAFDCLVQRFG